MRRWFPFVLFAITLLSFSDIARAQITCPPAAGIPPAVVNCGSPKFRSCSIDVGGTPRHFCAHRPAGPLPPGGTPVIVGLHGGGGMASRTVNWFDHGVDDRAILIAPSAMPSADDPVGGCSRRWRSLGGSIATWADFAAPDANGCGPAAVDNGHDLQFIEQLLDEIEAVEEVSAFYVFGFSNGAGMVLQLFITEPLASRFAGYGVVGNGINVAKIEQQAVGGSYLGFSENQNTRRPMMMIIGTDEKPYLAYDRMIDAVVALNAAGACPSVATPQEVIGCFARNPSAPGMAKNTLLTRRSETRDWLVAFNNAVPRAIESLYPDLGHGFAAPRQHDTTLVTRQHYPPIPNADSQPVTLLTVVDGKHNMPGADGNHAPCNGNCDIVGYDEIRQFWRAYADLQDWP